MRVNWCLALTTLAAVAVGGAAASAQSSRGQKQIERLEAGSFLVAGRELRDPNFRETVVLVVEHGRREGAVGLVINRPSAVDLSRVVGGEAETAGADPVFLGGPVEPLELTLLMRSREPVERADPVFDDVFFSSDRGLLEELARSRSATFRAYAGYAGWAPGQLELEISVGGWHVMDGRAETLFEQSTDKIWSRLILLGTTEWAGFRRGGPTLCRACRASP